MIRVCFTVEDWWSSNGCSCCEPEMFTSYNLSHIQGVGDPDKYMNFDYEMYNGSKSDEFGCLVSVFWDFVADKGKYEDFYDMYENFEGFEDSEIKLMLAIKGIEVVFLEE